MLNQIVLVGRIASDLEINEVNNKKVATITLAVSRSFKNENGEYETDLVPITIWNGIAENVCEYCKKGDVVGVKGRIQRMGNDYTANGHPIIEIVAEKVTFLSSQSVKMSEEMKKRKNEEKQESELE